LFTEGLLDYDAGASPPKTGVPAGLKRMLAGRGEMSLAGYTDSKPNLNGKAAKKPFNRK
jgi:hypothetical protein